MEEQLVPRFVSDMTIDQSMVTTFQFCKRKFYWRYLRMLTTPTKSSALIFGSCIHAALDAYYSAVAAPQDELQRFAEELAIKTFRDSMEELMLPSTNIVREERRTISFGEEILGGYFRRYPLVGEPFKVLESEVGFAFASITSPFNVGGKIDLIIESPYGIDCLDHKTTSTLGERFFDAYLPNLQLPTYILGTQGIMGQCSGGWINAIQTGVKKRSLERQRFQYSEFALNRTQILLDLIGQDIFDAYEACNDDLSVDTWFPMNPAFCVHKYPCEFRPLCNMDRDPTEIIPPESSFVVEDWRPWNL